MVLEPPSHWYLSGRLRGCKHLQYVPAYDISSHDIFGPSHTPAQATTDLHFNASCDARALVRDASYQFPVFNVAQTSQVQISHGPCVDLEHARQELHIDNVADAQLLGPAFPVTGYQVHQLLTGKHFPDKYKRIYADSSRQNFPGIQALQKAFVRPVSTSRRSKWPDVSLRSPSSLG
jgi:hypothetical protein